MPRSDINLDGAETSVIKAMGLNATEVTGEELCERVPEMLPVEVVDILKGLIMQGYVVADKMAFYDQESLFETKFHVNSGYSKDLKEALDPQRDKGRKSKRVRRE